MRKLVVLGIAVACLFTATSVSAGMRYIPQYRPAPAYRPAPVYRPVPVYRPTQQFRNYALPRVPLQHFGNLGIHRLPMVQGLHGWHETHNRTHFGMIPGPVLSSGGFGPSVDFDSFIDSIDTSEPLIPVSPCAGPCTAYGALSISNDAAWGGAWNYTDPGAATSAATANCAQSAVEVCTSVWIGGTAWVAGIHCENSAVHWSGPFAGDDPQSAITNAYRFAIQQRGYAEDDCSIVALIAANGAQQQFAQQ